MTKDRRFIYDGWNMIAEIDASLTDGSLALFRSYAWGNDLSGTPQGAGGVGGLLMIQERDLRRRHLAIQNTPPAVYAPCTDLKGNILSYIEINRGEGLTHSFEYDAFGKELTADTLVPTGNGTTKESLPFRFSTKYHDEETGLAYYGYRYYNTDLGRWLNRDPIAEKGGVNIYAMVGNDAVNRWDMLGLVERTTNTTLLLQYVKPVYSNGIQTGTSYALLAKDVKITWNCTDGGDVSSPIRAAWSDGSNAQTSFSFGFGIFGFEVSEALRIQFLRTDNDSGGAIFNVWYEEGKSIGANAVRNLASIEFFHSENVTIRGEKEVSLTCPCAKK